MTFPLLADGAMGTMLQRSGMRPGECGELWNLHKPEEIAAIHRAYVAAGAQALTTNTFGGNPVALARHNLANQCDLLSRRAVEIARSVAPPGVLVLGDVGPLTEFLEPYGDIASDDAKTAFRAQVGAFAEAGADGVIIETMVDPNEMAIAIRVAREFGSWPVIATFAFHQGFRTLMGSTVEQAVNAAKEAGADVVGANCGTDFSLSDYMELAQRLVGAADGTPVGMQPNAGSPEVLGGQIRYEATPEQMASFAKAALHMGVKVIGGCCGTTPDHIRTMAEVVRVAA